MSQYPDITPANMWDATPLEPEERMPGIMPRWQGVRATFGETQSVLLPLRVNNFGQLLPHIYDTAMHGVEGRSGRRLHPLTNIHVIINGLSELNGMGDYDGLKQSLQIAASGLPKGKLQDDAKDLLMNYSAHREQQKVKAAAILTRSIRGRDLYLVVYGNELDGAEPTPKVVELAGMISVRSGYDIKIKPVVRGLDGSEGMLPAAMELSNGVSAPKKNQ